MYGMVLATEKKICVSIKLCEGRLSHSLNTRNCASGETFVHLAQTERVAGETFTLVSQSVS